MSLKHLFDIGTDQNVDVVSGLLNVDPIKVSNEALSVHGYEEVFIQAILHVLSSFLIVCV